MAIKAMAIKLSSREAFYVNGLPVDLDFEAMSGKLNLILGPNGVGKTTFFTHLKINPELLQGRSAAFMDQKPFNPLADMKVEDALRVIFEELPGSRPWREVEEIKELGIEQLKDKSVSHLSGGENQKVKLAIALMRPFDILLADEPLQSLDGRNQELFLSIFVGLLKRGKTLIIIEHDVDKYNGVKGHMIRFNPVGNRVEVKSD